MSEAWVFAKKPMSDCSSSCLQQHWGAFQYITEIFILVPALLGLKGNLEMTLASRLSTAVRREFVLCQTDSSSSTSVLEVFEPHLGSGGRVWYPFSSFIQPPAEFILWLLSQPGECPPSCCGGDVSPRACAVPFLSCKLVSTDEPPCEHTYQQLLEADDEVKERRPLAPSMHAASTPLCQHVHQELQLCKLIVFPKRCWAGKPGFWQKRQNLKQKDCWVD